MKSSLIICIAVMVILSTVPMASADNILDTLYKDIFGGGSADDGSDPIADIAAIPISKSIDAKQEFIDENTTEIKIREGVSPILDKINSRSASVDIAQISSSEIYSVVKDVKLPYKFSDGTTTIVIKKIEYDPVYSRVGYWITATKDGKEVLTKSPIWIINNPLDISLSRTMDTAKNENTVTVKEDPQGAVEYVLSGYVSRQPLGMAEGDDTIIIYPTGDNAVYVYGDVATFALMRNATTGSLEDTSTMWINMRSYTTSNHWLTYERYYAGFNMTSVLSSYTVTGATLGIWGKAKSNTFTPNSAFELSNASTALWSAVAAGDYDAQKDYAMAPNVSYSSFSTTGYNNFTFNAVGLRYLTARKGTNATFSTRNGWDLYNTPPTWSSDKTLSYQHYNSAEAGKSPFLEITVAPAGSAPVASYTSDKTIVRIPGPLTLTNTSTNTPTSWNYSWGDATWTNGTTQNPAHVYTKRGLFTTYLIASNAFGTNTSASQTVRVVGYANE